MAGLIRYRASIPLLVAIASQGGDGATAGLDASEAGPEPKRRSLRGHIELHLTKYFSDLFASRDKKRSGSVDSAVFARLLEYSGMNFSAREMEAITHAVGDGSGGKPLAPPVVLTCSYMPVVCGELVSTIVCVILGTIQYQDSIPLLVAIASRASHLDAPGSPAQSLRLHSENSLAQYFEGLFQIRDAEGTGHINAAKLCRLLEYSGMGFSETEMAAISHAVQRDTDGIFIRASIRI